MEEEVPMEEVPAEAPVEEAVDPIDNLFEMLGELQERYGISQEEMDAVVDAINSAYGEPDMSGEEVPVEGEAPAEETWTCPECGMEVPVSETVCPECGYSLENEEA